jgi:hypothetical protein
MQGHAALWLKTNESCGDREELIESRNAFAMIKTIGYDPQRKGLNLRKGLFAGLPVCHYPRQLGYPGNPAAIIFTLKFNPHDLIPLMQVYLQPEP